MLKGCRSAATVPADSGGELMGDTRMEGENRQVGEAVIYVDEHKREHFALLTAIHGSGDKPCVNLVYVSSDANKTDTYGRQTERFSSCVHISNNGAGANCWKDLAE